MNYHTFREQLESEIAPALLQAGFDKIESDRFVRRRGDEINVLAIQKHGSQPICAVNLGVHYLFLPRAGDEQTSGLSKMDIPDCEIKLRLTPIEEEMDHWWPFESSAVHEISTLCRTKALRNFDRFVLQGEIARIETQHLSVRIPDILTSMTRVRACLLLARLNEHLGNKERAAAFAHLGIKIAGMAVGPKKAFKEMLKRLETTA